MPQDQPKWLSSFIAFSIVCSFALVFYSFTQVDLSLTLMRVDFWQMIQKSFQYIGYYNRPLSTVIFVLIVFALSFQYFVLLLLSYKNRITKRTLWVLIFLTSIILLFSYPAFSYDIFNYMFYAKTIAFYGKNPYQVVPLDFTGVEPWLSFMHWTHVSSA